MSENRTEQIWSRVTKQELIELDADAKRAGMSRSSYINFCIRKVHTLSVKANRKS